jgi:UDP:flavonoid glycosyltransferase YjiC (YdhE family)
MAHFAIISQNEAGHLLPIGTVGKELVRRGHRVTVVARANAAPLVEQLGLALHKIETEDVPHPSGYWVWLQWLAFDAVGAGWIAALRRGFKWDADYLLRKTPAALAELAVDGVLVDQNMVAAATVAERAGLPFVTLASALPWHEEPGVPPVFTPWGYASGWRARLRNRLGFAGWHWFMHPAMVTINRQRKAWGLPRLRRVGDAFSPLAQISQLCAECDFPRRELPPHFHYIGSFAANRRVNTDHRFPWQQLDSRPLIFASLGTIPDASNPPVFRKILAACAGLDAQLVLALGQWRDAQDSVREELGPIPDNAMVVDFAPQMELLDRAALLITHAGSNTVLEALCRGVPMVALPRNADQAGTGSRVAYTGAGLCASFKRCTPQELRSLVQRVLTDDTFGRRARELQHAMLAAGGAERAADIVEEALTTRRPVLRS